MDPVGRRIVLGRFLMKPGTDDEIETAFVEPPEYLLDQFRLMLAIPIELDEIAAVSDLLDRVEESSCRRSADALIAFRSQDVIGESAGDGHRVVRGTIVGDHDRDIVATEPGD